MNLYFAYGSNMDPKQIAKRCPNSNYFGIGYLPDYKLGFTRYSTTRKSAVADVLVSPGNEVWGLIYELNDEDIISLDKHEGHPSVYKRKVEKVMIFKPDPLNSKGLNNIHESILAIYEWNQQLNDLSKYVKTDVYYYEVVNKVMNAGNPSIEYMNHLLAGAEEHGLPEWYIQHLLESGKPAASQKRSEAVDFCLYLLDEIKAEHFQNLIKATAEWGGADLIITGDIKRKEKSESHKTDKVIVLTPYWKELSWLIFKFFNADSVKWQIDYVNKYEICKALGKSAIEYQISTPDDQSHVGICESVLSKAYELFTD